jgi:hypothetical protein
MDRNGQIRDHLKGFIDTAKRHLSSQYRYSNLLRWEIEQLKDQNTVWLNETNLDLEEYKKFQIQKIENLLNNQDLISEVENLYTQLPDLGLRKFQDIIQNQLLEHFQRIHRQLDHNDFQVNLIFFEYDFEPEAYSSGYCDEFYSHKVLSGESYIEYDYEFELFNGAGKMDYNIFVEPILQFKNQIGKEVENQMENILSGYFDDLTKLFYINGYYAMNKAIQGISKEIRAIGIPMKHEVHLLGNEHDCEPLNICIIE